MTDIDPRDTAPGKGDPTRSDDIDSPGLRSDHAGSGQLGASGGGYGSESVTGPSAGTPDGEDVQAQSGPGPQTDWLRSAPGGAGGEGSGEADEPARDAAGRSVSGPAPRRG